MTAQAAMDRRARITRQTIDGLGMVLNWLMPRVIVLELAALALLWVIR
jgi:hypothetical protein